MIDLRKTVEGAGAIADEAVRAEAVFVASKVVDDALFESAAPRRQLEDGSAARVNVVAMAGPAKDGRAVHLTAIALDQAGAWESAADPGAREIVDEPFRERRSENGEQRDRCKSGEHFWLSSCTSSIRYQTAPRKGRVKFCGGCGSADEPGNLCRSMVRRKDIEVIPRRQAPARF